MQVLLCSEILKAVGGTLICGDVNTAFTHISTDSRKIEVGDLFIPLVGENFDGHVFIGQSLDAGAAGALTQQDIAETEGKTVIRVENTSKALRDIAAYYRSKFDIPVVGITGSVGKTSTKDIVASVLSQHFNTLKTQGNFNNEIGLPLTLLNLEEAHEAAVIEMGMSGFGEISRLTSIARPHIAILTNIGLSHIEKLGSRENILKAKLEILEGLDTDGIVIINRDDDLLGKLKSSLKFRTVTYGVEADADYRAINVVSEGEDGTRFEVRVNGKTRKITVPAPGVHNVYNALAAIAAGVELGIPEDQIVDGIAQFVPSKMRMNIISGRGIKIINDVYNASPQSMQAAIQVLKELNKDRSVAVLGDMLEMGAWAEQAHYDVGKFAYSNGIGCIITVGENGAHIARGALESGASRDTVFSFHNNTELNTFLQNFVKKGDTLLVKGSRGMKMEQVVDFLSGFEPKS